MNKKDLIEERKKQIRRLEKELESKSMQKLSFPEQIVRRMYPTYMINPETVDVRSRKQIEYLLEKYGNK